MVRVTYADGQGMDLSRTLSQCIGAIQRNRTSRRVLFLSLGERCSINIIKWMKEWVCVGEGERERDTCNHMHTHTCFPSFSYSVIFIEHLSLFWGQGRWGERDLLYVKELASAVVGPVKSELCIASWKHRRGLTFQGRVQTLQAETSVGFQCCCPEAELCCFGEPQSGFSPPTVRKGVLSSESTGEMLIASKKNTFTATLRQVYDGIAGYCSPAQVTHQIHYHIHQRRAGVGPNGSQCCLLVRLGIPSSPLSFSLDIVFVVS